MLEVVAIRRKNAGQGSDRQRVRIQDEERKWTNEEAVGKRRGSQSEGRIRKHKGQVKMQRET